ncbi:MAG: hypothetical protein ACK4Z6_02835, partial [Candidatus Methylomirabilales bacterium]
GRTLGVSVLTTVDLQLWRWFFFGATLIVVMVLRPEGLFPSEKRRAELHAAEEASGELEEEAPVLE